MSALPEHIFVDTSYGRLALRSTGPDNGPVLLCIHGNSSTTDIFRPVLLNKNITSQRRVLAIDLPGHGLSEDAKDPATTYTMPAYAKACIEVLQKLGVSEVVVLGWSLGGHIGMEMTAVSSPVTIKGVMMIGSLLVPIWDAPIDDARTRWNMRQDLSKEELTGFAMGGTGGPFEQWMADAAIRTDPKARLVLFQNLGFGDCSNQQQLAAETKVPTAVVIGTDEPHLDNNMIKGLKYGNLWSGKCIEIQGGQHCPMWEKPAEFTPALESFIADVTA
jgi:pimeloyl-ACP methyl ester carboxylesterase